MQADRTCCTECGGTMESGYLLDVAENGAVLPTWTGGAPTRGWFGRLKIDRKSLRWVMTDRCTSCGFLKSFATRLVHETRASVGDA
jgi:hypothetical protein